MEKAIFYKYLYFSNSMQAYYFNFFILFFEKSKSIKLLIFSYMIRKTALYEKKVSFFS